MQQINLYLPELKPKKDWLCLEYCLFAVVIFILGMVTLQDSSNRKSRVLTSELSRLEQRRSTFEDELAKLKAKPEHSMIVGTADKTERLRAQIKARELLAQLIAGDQLGNRAGFSQQLQIIDSVLVPGISLESFSLQEGGRLASFTGRALAPDSVPLFLSRLQSHEAFSESLFGSLTINDAKGKLFFRTMPAQRSELSHSGKPKPRSGSTK